MRFGLALTPWRLLFGEVGSAFKAFGRDRIRSATGRPAETVRLFIRHIDQGRFKDAINLLPDALVRALGVDLLETILYDDSAEVRARGGVIRVDVVRDSWDLRAAEVSVDIHYKDGSKDSEQIVLTNQLGEWKIDMTR